MPILLLTVLFSLAVTTSIQASIAFRWSGSVTARSVVVKAKPVTSGSSVKIILSHKEDLASPLYTDEALSEAGKNNGVVSFNIENLEPDRRYFYGFEVDGKMDRKKNGEFKTFAEGPSSFTVAFGSCAETGSNHPVFDAIRESNPLLFIHMGDLHYSDIDEDNLHLYRIGYEKVLRSPRQSRLYGKVPLAYVWDDHDYGPNNSDANIFGKKEARKSYEEYVPHYPFAQQEGIQQAFTIGRVRFIMTDLRSQRSPYQEMDHGGKSMLGQKQKEWFKKELKRGKDKYALIVWVNTVPWVGVEWNEKYSRSKGDAWNRYAIERREIANFIEKEGIKNLAMISGDAHMVAIDDGSNTNYSDKGGLGFPLMHSAPLDRGGSSKGGPYSHGPIARRGQFGLMTVVDDGGERVRVEWSGRNYERKELLRYAFYAGGEKGIEGRGGRKKFRLVENLESLFLPWSSGRKR